MKTILIVFLCLTSLLLAKDPIPNERIDYPTFMQIAQKSGPVREKRRVTEEEFMAMAAEPGTVVLDARSADKYALRHIRGAVSLPFTDFTAESLARVIREKNSRVLIYCNNNFRGSPVALAAKMAPASLNNPSFEYAVLTLVKANRYIALLPRVYSSGTVSRICCGDASCIQSRARTVALVSACTVFGFFLTNSIGE